MEQDLRNKPMGITRVKEEQMEDAPPVTFADVNKGYI
jgi:hypothetical protein